MIKKIRVPCANTCYITTDNFNEIKSIKNSITRYKKSNSISILTNTDTLFIISIMNKLKAITT